MDLEEVRLKEPEELTDDEKDLLRENKDELSEEEQDVFKTVIEDNKEPEEESKPEPFKTFKSQEELDEYVKSQAPEPEPETQEEDDKPVDFFPSDYKPKDWNQLANDLLPKLKPEIRKETESYTQEQKEKIAEINKGFDEEIENLREIDNSIPAPGTKERADFDRSLAQVALKNKGVRNMTQAYAIYKKEQSGGEEKEEKSEDNQQEDIARKVGGGGKSGASKPEKKYADVAQMSEEEAWDAALRDLEASS